MNNHSSNQNETRSILKNDDASQLSAMFNGIMGLNSTTGGGVTSMYGDRELKSSVDENSSSCLDSDSS